jgi:hypothetical protein
MATSRDWTARAGAVAAGLMVAVALAAGGAPPGATGIELQVEAGLGGLAKPGRWIPARITIRSGASALDGELIVEWGAASVHRPVQLAAASQQSFELYLQTMQVGSAVRARLASAGADITSATVPVRTLRADEPFVLCLGPSSLERCTAMHPPDALPRSVRGFDAADEVLWTGGDESTLEPAQRQALDRWRVLRALDDNGSLGATDRPRSILPALSQKSRTGALVTNGVAAYMLLLLGAGLVLCARRARPAMALTAIAALIAAGSAGALAAGRVGPGSGVVIHHATLVQQLAGAGGSILTMQGAMEFPAAQTFVVRALLGDSAFDGVRRPDGGESQVMDANGFPLISGRFGMGARQPFTLQGTTDYHPLAVVRRGSVIHVTNTSPRDLDECVFGDRTVPADGVLRAGTTVSVTLAGSPVGPVITCASTMSPVDFDAGRRGVTTTGRTFVAAYLAPVEPTAEER